MSQNGMRGDGLNCSHWTDTETRHLIKIWRKPFVLAEIRDPSSKHKTVYKRIAKRIAAEGYHRDECQVRNKIRTMSTNFKKLMKMKDRTNWTGQGKQTFLYFNELREFLDGSFSTCASESAGEATALGAGGRGGQDRDSPNSPTAQTQPLLQLSNIKVENNHERVPATTAAFDRRSCLLNDEASLINTSGTPNRQLDKFSSDEEFDDIDSSQEIQVHPVTEAGWISEEDEFVSEEPRAKLRCKVNLRHPKRDRTGNTKKDETVKDLMKTLLENNAQRDKVLMDAEDAHRRMEAERHTEEI